MKITFLVPPSLDGHRPAERVFGCTYGLYPIPNIFVLWVAALLEREGMTVRFIDGPVEGWKRKDLEEFLKRDDSDIFSFYTVNLSEKTDLMASDLIRSIKGKTVPIIYFGPSPSHHPMAFLKDDNRIAVRGEPEYIFLSLVKALEKEMPLGAIKGVSFLEKGKITDNPPEELVADLDSLPFPARRLVKKDGYYNPKLRLRPFTAVLTSRGCSYRCHYCVPCSLSFSRELEYRRFYNKKPPVRLRSIENVREEFLRLKEEGYRSASILDDQFVWGEERTIKLCQAIAESGLLWGCLSRADRISQSMARAFKEARCQYVDIGVESFSQEVLNDIDKDLEVESVFKAVKMLKSYGVGVKLNILLGASPRQTREVMKRDISMARGLRPDAIMFSLANPFPGTEFYEKARQKGWLAGGYEPLDVQKKVNISYPGLRSKELEKMIRLANISFFFHPFFICRHLRRLTNFSTLIFDLKILARKLFGRGT